MNTPLLLAALAVLSAAKAPAQDVRSCVCSAPDAEIVLEADTVFRVVDRFDAALCGHIDRSVTPFVYSAFTLRSCITVAQRPLRVQGAAHGTHIMVSGGMLVVDELRSLPTGPDMVLTERPCWRTNYVLRLHEDTAQYAVNAMNELIADPQKPTAEQMARVQQRWDALRPSIYWTDQELLGQVFLCALTDTAWNHRFSELRGTYRFAGAVATYYDELLEILHEKRIGTSE